MRNIPLGSQFFTNSPGYNFSGPADYIKITLLQVGMVGVSGMPYIAWTGSQQLKIDGSGNVDTSGIILSVPTNDVITNLSVSFSGLGYICGSLSNAIVLTNNVAFITNNFYTKAAYSTLSGGAPDYSFFTNGQPEEVEVDFSGTGFDASSNSQIGVTVPVIASNDNATNLTIVVDIDRALMFYDGLGWLGSGPGSATNKAYFYDKLNGCIAAFFGEQGMIQGYETEFQAAPNTNSPWGNDSPGAGGWMTLIFDANTNFISGLLLPDNDYNNFNRESISSFDGSNFVYSPYPPQVYYISNFIIQSNLNDSEGPIGWVCPNTTATGQAAFQLLFMR